MSMEKMSESGGYTPKKLEKEINLDKTIDVVLTLSENEISIDDWEANINKDFAGMDVVEVVVLIDGVKVSVSGKAWGYEDINKFTVTVGDIPVVYKKKELFKKLIQIGLVVQVAREKSEKEERARIISQREQEIAEIATDRERENQDSTRVLNLEKDRLRLNLTSYFESNCAGGGEYSKAMFNTITEQIVSAAIHAADRTDGFVPLFSSSKVRGTKSPTYEQERKLLFRMLGIQDQQHEVVHSYENDRYRGEKVWSGLLGDKKFDLKIKEASGMFVPFEIYLNIYKK